MSARRRLHFTLTAPLVSVALVAVLSAAAGGPSTGGQRQYLPAIGQPNVIVIVADDLDDKLMRYLPNVRRLIGERGAELTDYYVEQSTCCTSRASIFSGRYAHNHGVEANTWPKGGFDVWKRTGESNALPTWLHAAGYRNAMMGKYFNQYPFHLSIKATPTEKKELATYVPPGWDDWVAAVRGNPYAQYHYQLNVNGVVDRGFRRAYLDEVLGKRAVSLVSGAHGFDFAAGGQFLYYAPYSPHHPYAHPARYATQFSSVRYPRTPSFDEADVSDKFGMTRTKKRLTVTQKKAIDRAFRERIRSVQVLDRNVGRLVGALQTQGALDNTYLVFTSDNGYNMGEHRREIGKYNQFQEALSVPLYVRGPGIRPGTRIHDLTGNIDLAPTVAAMAGASAPADVDGLSLLPRLTGARRSLPRSSLLIGRALIPTNRRSSSPVDEAPEEFVARAKTSRLNDFSGVVTRRYKLVRYTHLPHEEFYDLKKDPYELTNLLARDGSSYRAMSPALRRKVRELRRSIDALVDCAGPTCRR
ncbi:MAG: hypothetical protein JWO11_951 [Nocardioides sp.]|nr:hypothetical protein [Nocardioides sp.]